MIILRISCIILDLVTAIDEPLELCMVNLVQRCVINISIDYWYTRCVYVKNYGKDNTLLTCSRLI